MLAVPDALTTRLFAMLYCELVFTAPATSNFAPGATVPTPTLVPLSKICEFPIHVTPVNLGMVFVVPPPASPPDGSQVTEPSALTTRIALPAAQVPATRN